MRSLHTLKFKPGISSAGMQEFYGVIKLRPLYKTENRGLGDCEYVHIECIECMFKQDNIKQIAGFPLPLFPLLCHYVNTWTRTQARWSPPPVHFLRISKGGGKWLLYSFTCNSWSYLSNVDRFDTYSKSVSVYV